MQSRFFTTDASSFNLDLITHIDWALEETEGVETVTATLHFSCSRSMTVTGEDAEALRDALDGDDDGSDDGADLLMETLGDRIKEEATGKPAVKRPRASRRR